MIGNGRRSDIRIVGEILKLAQGGACQTRIMYGSNLNYRRLKDYLGFLESKGLLVGTNNSPRITYRTTSQGLEVLEHIEKALNMFEIGA